jgi:carbon-monoxide dehydrogenase medium subunit
VPEAGRALLGTTLEKAMLEQFEAAVRAACRPIDDKRGTREFRSKVAAVMARRAALIAYERARSR